MEPATVIGSPLALAFVGDATIGTVTSWFLYALISARFLTVVVRIAERVGRYLAYK
jgi:hypothetical protein